MKSVLKRKFVTVSAYSIKWEGVQIHNIVMHPKALEKQEQTIPKESQPEEIIKIRADINEVETN